MLNRDTAFNVNGDSSSPLKKENKYAILRWNQLHGKESDYVIKNKSTTIQDTIRKRKLLPIISLRNRGVIHFRLSTLSHNTITTSAQGSHNVGHELDKVVP